MLASVEIADGSEVVILSVTNLSITGVLVAADGQDLSPFTIGRFYRLCIFDPENERYQVELLARGPERASRDGVHVG